MNVSENTPSILIIGIGNLYRCDDAMGILVARKLKRLKSDRLRVMEQNGEGTVLMEAWKGFNNVLIIDAVSSGAIPGSIHRLDATKESIPSKYFSCSSHNFGVGEAIELARALDQLPEQLKLYGIEGKNFEPGEVLSPGVESTMELIVEEISQFVSSLS